MSRNSPSENHSFEGGLNKDSSFDSVRPNQVVNARNVQITAPNSFEDGSGFERSHAFTLTNLPGMSEGIEIPSIPELPVYELCVTLDCEGGGELEPGGDDPFEPGPDDGVLSIDLEIDPLACSIDFASLASEEASLDFDVELSCSCSCEEEGQRSFGLVIKPKRFGLTILDVLAVVNDPANNNLVGAVDFCQQSGGASPLSIPAQDDLVVIGSQHTADEIILFTTSKTNADPEPDPRANPLNANVGQVWRVPYSDFNTLPAITLDHLKYNDRNNFSLRHQIKDVVYVPEGESANAECNRLLYWTDNFNPIGFLNINQPDGILNTTNPLFARQQPDSVLGELYFNGYGNGALPEGVFVYAYRMVAADGAYSSFSPVTRGVNCFLENRGTYADDRPRELGQNTRKSVFINLENLDSRYDEVELVATYFQTPLVASKAVIVGRRKINAATGTVLFEHKTMDLEETDWQTITALPLVLSKAKNLLLTSQRLVAANYCESRPIDFDQHLETMWDFATDANTNAELEYDDGTVIPNRTIQIEPIYHWIESDTYYASNTLADSSGQDYAQGPPYTQSNRTFGQDKQQGDLDSINILGQPFPANNTDLPFNIAINGDYVDAKGGQVAHYYKGYMDGEVYRIGIKFHLKDGSKTEAYWLGDYQFPKFATGAGAQPGFVEPDVAFINNEQFPPADTAYYPRLAVTGFSLTGIDLGDEAQRVDSFEIVVAERDKRIICQALATPSLRYYDYDYLDRESFSFPDSAGATVNVPSVFYPDIRPSTKYDATLLGLLTVQPQWISPAGPNVLPPTSFFPTDGIVGAYRTSVANNEWTVLFDARDRTGVTNNPLTSASFVADWQLAFLYSPELDFQQEQVGRDYVIEPVMGLTDVFGELTQTYYSNNASTTNEFPIGRGNVIKLYFENPALQSFLSAGVLKDIQLRSTSSALIDNFQRDSSVLALSDNPFDNYMYRRSTASLDFLVAYRNNLATGPITVDWQNRVSSDLYNLASSTDAGFRDPFRIPSLLTPGAGELTDPAQYDVQVRFRFGRTTAVLLRENGFDDGWRLPSLTRQTQNPLGGNTDYDYPKLINMRNLLVNVIDPKDPATLYGGRSISAIENTVFNTTGTVVRLGCQAVDSVVVFGGDVYSEFYTRIAKYREFGSYLQTGSSNPLDEGEYDGETLEPNTKKPGSNTNFPEDYITASYYSYRETSPAGQEGVAFANKYHSGPIAISFPIKSTINTTLRSSIVTGDTKFFLAEENLNMIHEEPEPFLYDTVYSLNGEADPKAGFVPEEEDACRECFPTRLITTRPRVPFTEINNWQSWLPLEFKDLDQDLGPINHIDKLLDTLNQIYYWQDRSYGFVYVDQFAIKLNDQTQAELGTGRFFNSVTTLSNQVGARHKMAITRGRTGFYFYDQNSSAIYRFVPNVTQEVQRPNRLPSGLDAFIQRHFKQISNVDNPLFLGGVHMAWNDPASELLVTMIPKAESENEPISFSYSEATNRFVSFLDASPRLYIPISGGTLLSQEPSFDSTNLFAHYWDRTNRNFIYGEQVPRASEVEFVVNQGVLLDKIIHHLVVSSYGAWERVGIATDFMYDLAANQIFYWDEQALVLNYNLFPEGGFWKLPINKLRNLSSPQGTLLNQVNANPLAAKARVKLIEQTGEFRNLSFVQVFYTPARTR